MKKLIIVTRIFLVTVIFIVYTNSLLAADVAIIVNSSSSAKAIDSKTAKKIFLGRIKSIPSINKLLLVDQQDSSLIKVDFTKKIVKRKMKKYKAFWTMRVFSGKAAPSKMFRDDAEVKSFISRHPNAIGYIDAASADDTVKVLLRSK